MNTNQSPTHGVKAPNKSLITLAWVGILAVGAPTIILRLLVRDLPAEPITPVWLAWAQLAILVLLWVVTWVWPAVKPLRGFTLALLAFWVGYYFILPFVMESAAWSNWIGPASWGIWIVAFFGARLIPTALMALTLIGSGNRRRELFLVRGDPRALAQPSHLMPGILDEPKPWNRVAREWLPYYVIIVVVVVGIQMRPDVSQISKVLIYLPAIIIAAAIIAFTEEFQIRSMLLSRLGPVLGSQQTILLTSVLFGLLHYFGWPSGPLGVLLAAYLGWWAAKSMIETRGFVWAFTLHFLGDFIIYAFCAMLALRF